MTNKNDIDQLFKDFEELQANSQLNKINTNFETDRKIHTFSDLQSIIKKGREKNRKSKIEELYLGKHLETGKDVFCSVNDFVHGVVVGQTGSGKSCTILNFALINHLILNEQARWYFADGKNSGDFEHLNCLTDLSVATKDPESISFDNLINHIWEEYTYRSTLFKEARNRGSMVCNIFEYRELVAPLPRIFIVIDELKCFFTNVDFDSESQKPNSTARKIIRLLAESRSFGFTFIFSSQRFQQDSLPTAIRGNLPTRIIHHVQDSNKQILGINFDYLNKGQYILKSDFEANTNNVCTMPFLGTYKDIDKFIFEADIKQVIKNPLNIPFKKVGYFQRLWNKIKNLFR